MLASSAAFAVDCAWVVLAFPFRDLTAAFRSFMPSKVRRAKRSCSGSSKCGAQRNELGEVGILDLRACCGFSTEWTHYGIGICSPPRPYPNLEHFLEDSERTARGRLKANQLAFVCARDDFLLGWVKQACRRWH